MKRNNSIRRGWATPLVLSGAAFTLLLTSAINTALAAKPPKPPPPPPPPAPYTYLYLGGWGASGAHDGHATAVNNVGQVVGYWTMSSGDWRSFIVLPQDTNGDGQPDRWNAADTPTPLGLNPLMTDLGVPTGVQGVTSVNAAEINDLGQVIGQCWGLNGFLGSWLVNPLDANGDGQPDTWFEDDGTGANALMIPLVLPGSYIDWIAINNSGQIVVTCEGVGLLLNPVDADSDGRPDTWYQDLDSDGVNDLLVDLGQAFDSGGNLVHLQACDLNDAGQIVGYIGGTPFLLTPEQTAAGPVWAEDLNGDGENDLIVRLPMPLAGSIGYCPMVVNNTGSVAGNYRTSKGTYRAILWRTDAQGDLQYTDLGVPNSETAIRSQGINDGDQVVGDAILYGNVRGIQNTVKTWSGWLWDNGVMSDVRTLMDKSAELTGRFMFTAGINNASHMVGFAAGTVGYYPWIAVPIR